MGWLILFLVVSIVVNLILAGYLYSTMEDHKKELEKYRITNLTRNDVVSTYND